MLDYQLICYSNPWIISDIHYEVGKLTSKITNTDRLESRIIVKVGKYLVGDPERLKNKNYVKKLVMREVHDSLKRDKKELATYFSDISYEDSESEELTYEPTDVLANVESGLEIKEAITLLAKGDRKRNLILTEWANGSTNDSELSDTLASVFGGQARSHCKFIQRFRIECQANYLALAI